MGFARCSIESTHRHHDDAPEVQRRLSTTAALFNHPRDPTMVMVRRGNKSPPALLYSTGATLYELIRELVK
jgi:hypothetical protein